jgi:spermine oxidase
MLFHVVYSGQWIHGEGGNSIYELARPFFNFGDTGFESATYLHSQSNGAALNQAMVNRVFSAANEIMEDYSRMMLDRGSLGEYFHREFMARLQRPDMADVPLDLAMSVEEFIHETQCSYYATHDWNRIEARHHATWDVTEGNQWLTWRDRGFQTVFNIIQSPRQGTFFNVTGRIQLNKVVSRIVWNEGGRTRVHCTDGSQYTADHVIVTVSLGVLKATHTTLFQPALPPSKVSSIQHMEYGTLEKVIMVYQQPFWPADDPNWVQYSILWTREDIAALTGTEREW